MGIGFIFFGGLGFIIGIFFSYRTLRIKNWPSTYGKLIKNEIGLTKRAVATGPETRWEVYVEYEYEINNKKYKSDQIYALNNIMMKKDAETLSKKLKTPLTVIYNPKNPAEAYLLKSSSILYVIITIFSFLIMFAGIGSFLQN